MTNDAIAWKDYVQNLPTVATVVVKNNEQTIYECLLSVAHQVDACVIVFDNSLDSSAYEVDKFVRRQRPKNLFVFDLTFEDPWPNYLDKSDSANSSRSQFKACNLARQLAHDSLLISIDPSVRLTNNSRKKIQELSSLWTNPEIQCNFLTDDTKSSIMTLFWSRSRLFPGPKSTDSCLSICVKNESGISSMTYDRSSTVCIAESLNKGK